MNVKIPIDEYIATEHIHQENVRSLTKRFQVCCWHRRARKTTMALNTLIENCCKNRNTSYGYIAPTYKQAKSIAVVDPNMLKKYLPREVCKKPFNESELRQEFITDSVLEIKGADDPDSIRGVGWQGVVIEEWAMMKHGRTIWEEILYPVLTENGGWAIFIFTPKGKNFAYEYFERAKKDTTGKWGYSLLRASESGLIKADDLLIARQQMPMRLYNQEFECAFLEGASSVFHNVEEIIGGEPKEPVVGHRYVLGADIGRFNDYTVLTVIDCLTNAVVHVQRFSDTEYAIQKEFITLLAKKYNNAQVVIDATGFSAGSVIYEQLNEAPIEQDLRNTGLQVVRFNFSGKSKKALVDKLMVAIEQRLITIPACYEFVKDELNAFTYETTDYGNVRYTAPEGLHDDCVMSLGLAVYGLGSYMYAPIRQKIHRRQPEPAGRSNLA